MSYQKDREAFIVQFVRAFPSSPMHIAQTLLREASAAQRQNEIECSINVGEAELARLEKREEARNKRVARMAETIGASLEMGGDPRGNPFALKNQHGVEVSVPGRGLPARCFR